MNSPQIDIQIIQEWINTQLNANKQMDATFAMILPIAITRFNMNSETYWKLAEAVCPNITGREQYPFASPLLWPLLEDFNLTVDGVSSFLKKTPFLFKEAAAKGFARLWRQQDWKISKKEYVRMKESMEIKDLPWISIQPENFNQDAYKLLLTDILELEKLSVQRQSMYGKKDTLFKWDAGKKKLYESIPIKDWPKLPKHQLEDWEYYGHRVLQQLKNNNISPDDFEKLALPHLRSVKLQLSRDIAIEIAQKNEYVELLFKDFYSNKSVFKIHAKDYLQYKEVGLKIILDDRFEALPAEIALTNYINDELFDTYLKRFIETNKHLWLNVDSNPEYQWMSSNLYKIDRLKPYILADLYIKIVDMAKPITSKTPNANNSLTHDQLHKINSVLGIDLSSKDKIATLIKETTGINPVVLDLCTNKYERMKMVYDLLHQNLTFEPTTLPENLGMSL